MPEVRADPAKLQTQLCCQIAYMTANFEPIAKITIDHIAGPKQRMYRHVCLTIGDILHRNRGVFGFDQHDPGRVRLSSGMRAFFVTIATRVPGGRAAV
jgi:hypothetical protein